MNNVIKYKNIYKIIVFLGIFFFFLVFFLVSALKQQISPAIINFDENYYIERQDGNESFFDVGIIKFNNQSGNYFEINVTFNQTKMQDYLNENNFTILQFNYIPDKNISLLINQINQSNLSRFLIKGEGNILPIFQIGDTYRYQFIANPKKDHIIKIGKNSIVIKQRENIFTLALHNNTISEPNNISHLLINNAAPYNSLVAYWSFDSDRVNTTAYDWTANNLDGTYFAGTKLDRANCFLGSCANFSETTNNKRITLPDNKTLNLTSFTVVYWLRPLTNDSIRKVLRMPTSAIYLGTTTNATIITNYNNASGSLISHTTTNNQFNNSQYYHIAHVVGVSGDNVNSSIYKNGVPIFSANRTDGKMQMQVISIGDTLFNSINGTLDELMIFNTNLTPQQILNIYNNQSARFFAFGNIETTQIFNISIGNNRMNISLDQYENNFSSNISSRLGEWYRNNGYDENLTGILSNAVFYSHYDNNPNSSIGNHNATITGATITDRGVYNMSTNFSTNGLNKYDYNTNLIILNLTGNITASFWFRGNASTTIKAGIQSIISRNLDDKLDDSPYFFGINTTGENQRLYFGRTQGANYVDFQSNIIQNYDSWNHAVIIYNRTDGFVSFYINGLFDSIQSASVVDSISGNNDFIVGQADGETGFTGQLDEVIIWNNTLNGTDIIQLYDKGRANWNYTTYQNITGININLTFNISTSTTNILPNWGLTAGTAQFYTPILMQNATFDVWNVDTTIPLISYGTGTENDGINLTRNNIYVNVTASDNNFANITIFLHNSSAILQTNSSTLSTFFINYTSLTNGTYFFNATATDTANNKNTTQTRTVNISTLSTATSIGGGSGIIGRIVQPPDKYICNLTYSYKVNSTIGDYSYVQNIIDKIISEKGLLNYPSYSIIVNYIDNWQQLCSDYIGRTLKENLVCRKIFYMIINTNNSYKEQDIENMRVNLEADIRISSELLRKYADNFEELCVIYNNTLPFKIKKEREEIRKITGVPSCDTTLGIKIFSFSFDESIPLPSIYIPLKCNYLKILRYIFSFDKIETGYVITGIRTYIILSILFLGVIILMIMSNLSINRILIEQYKKTILPIKENDIFK